MTGVPSGIAGGARAAAASMLVTVAVVALALVLAPGVVDLDGVAIRPHAPDWSVLARASPAVQVHLAAAVLAFAVGAVQLAGPKGTLPHRLLGWTWVLAMLAAAASSLFIREINHGAFSVIHVLSGLTLVSLPMAVHAARKGRVAAHRGTMLRLYFGGLVVAGVLAFLPGRTLWAMFLG